MSQKADYPCLVQQWHPISSNLESPEPDEFEFIPNVGFRYVGDGRSVVLSSLSVAKEGVDWTDPELIAFGQATQRHFDRVKGLPLHDYAPAKIFTDRDFRPYESTYAYKFVSEETYERFIVRGSFLVSSLERLRELEEQGSAAGDRFEGSSFCAYTVGGRVLSVSTVSGFDTHIFSLTRNLDHREQLSSRFGPVVLRVRLRPFARMLARHFGCSSPDVRLVRYSDLKLHRGRLTIGDVEQFPPHLTARLARALRERGRLPAIFGKPNRFEDEQEVRIAVRVKRDVAYATSVDLPGFDGIVERVT